LKTYLRLNQSEEKTFQTEIARMSIAQKEEIMEVTTSWEEKGMEKAQRAIALEMLQENLPLDQISRLTKLTIAQIKKLQSEKS
jgi:predicted transposase YdaD